MTFVYRSWQRKIWKKTSSIVYSVSNLMVQYLNTFSLISGWHFSQWHSCIIHFPTKLEPSMSKCADKQILNSKAMHAKESGPGHEQRLRVQGWWGGGVGHHVTWNCRYLTRGPRWAQPGPGPGIEWPRSCTKIPIHWGQVRGVWCW